MMRKENKLKEFAILSFKKEWVKEERAQEEMMMKIGMMKTCDYYKYLMFNTINQIMNLRKYINF